jgi:hypothetical protein
MKRLSLGQRFVTPVLLENYNSLHGGRRRLHLERRKPAVVLLRPPCISAFLCSTGNSVAGSR